VVTGKGGTGRWTPVTLTASIMDELLIVPITVNEIHRIP